MSIGENTDTQLKFSLGSYFKAHEIYRRDDLGQALQAIVTYVSHSSPTLTSKQLLPLPKVE